MRFYRQFSKTLKKTLIAVSILLCSQNSFADEITVAIGNFNYLIDTEWIDAQVSGFSSNANIPEEVFIPNSVNYKGVDYPVTVIQREAFKGTATIKKVTIGDEIMGIMSKAFSECPDLETVELPSKLINIYTDVFINSLNLQKVITKAEKPSTVLDGQTDPNLKDNVTLYVYKDYIPAFQSKNDNFWGNFSDYKDIESLDDSDTGGNGNEETPSTETVPKFSIIYDEYSGYGVERLTNYDRFEGVVTVPSIINNGTEDRVISFIKEGCFADANKVTEIIIEAEPNTKYFIERDAFSRCSLLSRVTVPEHIFILQSHAFDNCPALKSVICTANSVMTLYNPPSTYLYDKIALYVNEELLDQYKESGWNTVFRGNIYPIGSPEHISLLYEKYRVNFHNMMKGHSIFYDGCTIPYSTIGDYTYNSAERKITIDRVGGFSIIAQNESPSTNDTNSYIDTKAGTTAMPEIHLGSATFYIPELDEGHKLTLIASSVKGTGFVVDEELSNANFQTIIVTNPTSFTATPDLTGVSGTIDLETECEPSVSVYGNTIYINGVLPGSHVTIHDIYGRTINSTTEASTSSNGTVSIKSANVIPGIYIVSVNDTSKKIYVR